MTPTATAHGPVRAAPAQAATAHAAAAHAAAAHPAAARPAAQAAAVARPAYRARLAASIAEVRAAQALRFQVFNLELDEGLAQSYDTGLDADAFDAVCDHLVVEHVASAAIVGTYRMQTGTRAGTALGYYGEREFDFAPFEPMRSQMLELGRACIDEHHRNFAVLNLLWRGIAAYARERGARYLVGCSSLPLYDAGAGLAAYATLRAHLAPAPWRTLPRRGSECRGEPDPVAPPVPRLLSAYLALGAGICGPPAIDREFGTIDFLTWLDVRSPRMLALQRRWGFGG